MLSPDQHQELLDNVVEEFTERLRQGQRPSIAEFKTRHPVAADEIEELLTSVAMIEELKNQTTTANDSLKNEIKQITKLERIGDYRIIRELGRGGMGVVFEAIHESLGRRVAIKVMPNRTFDDAKYLERFQREAQAAATLHHTNIVSVFGIGQAGEHHYYVMEFVDGQSLADLLKQLNQMSSANTEVGWEAETRDEQSIKPQTDEFGPIASKQILVHLREKFDSSLERFRWTARIGAQLADGLAYAHGLNTLHRDIKPSNLLIDKNETVWLTDFGLVKNTSHQTITKTGDIIGTPQYMAPESFEGTYDERSETYCLGLTLYEMATLKPAFANATTPELIKNITTSTPTPPKKLEPKIPRDLNRIILKSVSKEPSYRYQSAAALRDDLRAFLDDRPIAARQISLVENMWRWSRRNPAQAALSFFSAVMLLTIAVGATLALIKNNQLYQQSEERLTSAKTERRVSAQARELAESAIDVTVQSVDKLFRSIAFKNSDAANEFSLDGFGDLEGVSATLRDTDAEVLQQMLQFYSDFASDKRYRSNVQLKAISALAHRRVANIYHLMGEYETAIEAYENATSIYNEIYLTSLTNTKAVLDLVKTINECGKAIESRGNRNDKQLAVEKYQESAKILRARLAVESEQNAPLVRTELAKSLILQGSPTVQHRVGLPEMFGTPVRRQYPEMFRNRRAGNTYGIKTKYVFIDKENSAIDEALEITNDLSTQYSRRQMERLSDFAKLTISSWTEYLNWNWNEARVFLTMAKFRIYSVLADYNDKEDLQFIKAMALTRLGHYKLASKKPLQARNSLRLATELMKDLVDSDAYNPEYKFLLAQILATGYTRDTRGIKLLEESKKLLIGLVAMYESRLDYSRMLAEVCFRLGMAYRKTNDLEFAHRSFEMCNEMYKVLVPQTPRNREIQFAGFASLLYYLETLVDQGETEQAVAILESNIDALSGTGGPWSGMNSWRKGMLYSMLSIVHRKNGDSKNYKAAVQKSEDIRREIRNRRNFPGRVRRSPTSPN